MIRTCADFGVEAATPPRAPRCWVGRKKVGAVGVHFSRWITSHGLAFNAAPTSSTSRRSCRAASPTRASG